MLKFLSKRSSILRSFNEAGLATDSRQKAISNPLYQKPGTLQQK